MISLIMAMAVAVDGWAAPPPSDVPLSALLGPDYAGARIVALGGKLGKSVIVTEVATRESRTLASFDDDARRLTVSRPFWSPEGSQVVFAYDGTCWLARADGTSKRQILADERVTGDPSFWQDPQTGELCVVYSKVTGTDGRGEDVAETWLHRLAGGGRAKLADGMFNAGLSRDGTRLGNAGGGVWVHDVPAGTTCRLNAGMSACNGSMSPDATGRIMFLYAPHRFFGIRDQWDHELWRMGGHSFEWPRWSNHPDFCTVQFDGLRVVRISTKEDARVPWVKGGLFAHLWLPSAAQGAFDTPGPIDHLVLNSLSRYKRRLADTVDYSPVIAELARSDHPEAKLIVSELEKQGEAKLVGALASNDPLQFVPDVRELAARYRAHPIGQRASRILESPQFGREIEAASARYALWRLESSLNGPVDAPRLFTDPVFAEYNRGTLAQMVEVVASARHRLAGTKGLLLIERAAAKYALPAQSLEPGGRSVTVVAAIEKVSRVPTLQEIAPYKDAVTYVQYRVQDVVNGDYANSRMLAVHYVIRDKKQTKAAEWKPGLKQLLTVDRFDAHPKLDELPAADDANDLRLVPYWATEVFNSW